MTDKELYKKLKEIDWFKIFKLNNTFSTSATTNSDTFLIVNLLLYF